MKRYDLSTTRVMAPSNSRRILRALIAKTNRLLPLLIGLPLFLCSAALLIYLAWKSPQWFVGIRSIVDTKDRIILENEVLKNILQVVGGTFLLAGLYFTWRNLYLTKEGQVTERFNKAIDHLGEEKLEVRLGGIYALARIARDSSKDHWPVMQILCAYVRSRTRTRDSLQLGTDVQAVLDILGDRSYEFETEVQHLDLTGIDVAGANLRSAFLDHSRLDGSNLEGVDFMRASLRQVDFRGARLQRAHLREACLDGANFVASDLRDASLRMATLRNTNLLGANLQGATLIGADLSRALYVTRGQISSAILDDTTRMPSFLDESALEIQEK
jgi:hypothetical protein